MPTTTRSRPRFPSPSAPGSPAPSPATSTGCRDGRCCTRSLARRAIGSRGDRRRGHPQHLAGAGRPRPVPAGALAAPARAAGRAPPSGSAVPAPEPGCGTDGWPPEGGLPGSSLDLMRDQLLDRWSIERGILNPLLEAGELLNLEYGAAFAQAINDWQVAEWLEPEPRLRASITVPYEDAPLAVA